MPSNQEGTRNGQSSETLERRLKEKCIDDALARYENTEPNAFTFVLALKEVDWRIDPANADKSHEDFIAHAREQMLAWFDQ